MLTGCTASSRSAEPRLSALYQPGDQQQDDRTDGRIDDGGYRTADDDDSEDPEQPGPKESSDDSNEDIAEDPEAGTPYNLAGQPPGDQANQKWHDQIRRLEYGHDKPFPEGAETFA
jgi:hypothetical protein